MKKNYLMLQLFAEGADESAATDENTTDNAAENSGASKQGNDNKPAAKDAPKYTDADVNNLLNKKFAEWQAKQDRKNSEAEKLAKMTAEEKANARLKALEDKLKEYELKDSRAAMATQARNILQDKGVHINDDLLSNLIAADAESTKTNVESFISLYEKAVENAVKEKLKGAEAPKKGGTSGYTKEDILKVANRAERQRLIQENIHLFK